MSTNDDTDQAMQDINVLNKRKTIHHQDLSTDNPRPTKRFKQDLPRHEPYEDRLTPTTEHGRSSNPPNNHTNPLPQTHFSALAGAHHFVSNGATYNNILGNYIVMAKASEDGYLSHGQILKGIIQGRRALDDEDVSLERQIHKGSGYRIYSALNKQSGKIVSMKVYEGSRAKERCLEAARFIIKVMHSNIPHLIAVSALRSAKPFLIFDSEYECTVENMLSQVLKKDLKQILTLGLQTVIGLSSGLDYLQYLKYPFASVGLNHFVVLSCKGKAVICFDPEDLSQISETDDELGLSNDADGALALFHGLCQRTFDEACKAHYESQIQRTYVDEFDILLNDLPESRFEELDNNSSTSIGAASPSATTEMPLSRGSRRRPSGRRQELVWKFVTGETVTLDDISRQFQNILNFHRSSSEPALNSRRGRYTARTSHRCPGYNRIEITLNAVITRSAIVSHSSPIPGEICPICTEIVKEEIFSCICGGNDDESMPTVRCSTCSKWHHRPCVLFIDLEHHKFVCDHCNGSIAKEQSRNGPPPHAQQLRWQPQEMRQLPPQPQDLIHTAFGDSELYAQPRQSSAEDPQNIQHNFFQTEGGQAVLPPNSPPVMVPFPRETSARSLPNSWRERDPSLPPPALLSTIPTYSAQQIHSSGTLLDALSRLVHHSIFLEPNSSLPFSAPAYQDSSQVTQRKSTSSSGVGPIRTEKQTKHCLHDIDRMNICLDHFHHPNASQKDIDHPFAVESSTIGKIFRDKEKWLNILSEDESYQQTAKIRPSKIPQVEEAMQTSLQNWSDQGTAITNQLIRQRALELAKSFHIPPEIFKGSIGWVEEFKIRHDIRRGEWRRAERKVNANPE